MVGQQYWMCSLVVEVHVSLAFILCPWPHFQGSFTSSQVSLLINNNSHSLSFFNFWLLICFILIAYAITCWIFRLENYSVHTFIGSKPHIQAGHFCVHTCCDMVIFQYRYTINHHYLVWNIIHRGTCQSAICNMSLTSF